MKAIIRQFRINQRIRAKEVRLIGDDGEQLGVVPLSEALKLAQERDSDLVEVAPSAVPPVCRVLDYGKFKYEQAKKERESRKRQKVSTLRRVRLRPKIDGHDLAFKTRLVKKLLDGGDKVKVTVIFRGREITHPQLGRELLEKVSQELGEGIITEKVPTMEGRNMIIIFSPSKQSKNRKA